MLALLGVTLALLVAAALAGAAIWRAAGWTQGHSVAPAVGLAALLLVAAEGARLPGGATTAAAACGALVLVGAAALAAVPLRRGCASRRVAVIVAATAALALLIACLPFAASGRTGVLGAGDNNDMSVHLTTAWALVHGVPDAPSLAGRGYPVGPHALVAALHQGLGASLPDGFTAVTLAAPVVAAVAALAALGSLRPALRVPVGALVGLPYLMAAYLGQGSFKEELGALLVLAFALALRTLGARPAPARAGTPLGILAAATLVVYSLPGLAWPAAAIALAGVVTIARASPRDRLELRHAVRAPVRGAVIVVVAVLVAEAPRLVGFAGSSFAHEPTGGLGNLLAPIPAWEALGVWLSPDYRLTPHPDLMRLGPALAAGAVGLWALAGWLRRGEAALLASLAGAVAVAGFVAATRNPYDAAKPLAVLAPLAMLGLASTLRPGAGWAPRARRAAGAVVLILAAASTVMALRNAPVAPAVHERGLEALGRQLGSAPTLYLGTDDFAGWALRGAVVARPIALYPGWTVPLRADVPYGAGDAVDPALINAATLDRFIFLITPVSGYDPAPPPNFRLVSRAGGYGLWRRSGRTPERRLPGADPAGGVLDCSTPEARGVLSAGGFAVVAPAPVVGSRSRWSILRPEGGQASRQVLDLPSAGTWTLSLQYASTQPLEVSAPGLRTVMPASLDRLGPHWLAGTLLAARAGPTTVTVTPHRGPLLGRLLGAGGATRAQDSIDGAPLGELAAVARQPEPMRRPLVNACGRWVRSLTLRGDTAQRSQVRTTAVAKPNP